jgi:hypothetical protein
MAVGDAHFWSRTARSSLGSNPKEEKAAGGGAALGFEVVVVVVVVFGLLGAIASSLSMTAGRSCSSSLRFAILSTFDV